MVIRRADARASGSVVTVGTYDGVHLGHQRLIGAARNEGDKLGLPVIVVTFDRNPLETVRPDLAPKLLTDLDLKLELLESTGVEEIVVLSFDAARAMESAEDFVRRELCDTLGAKSVLVGANFRFGHRQGGDIALLQSLGAELGFRAQAIELVLDEATQTIVSSSRIRELVSTGHLDEAARLLGRAHEVRGVLVRRGDGPRRRPDEDSAGDVELGPDSDRDTVMLEIAPALVLPPPGRYPALIGPPRGGLVPSVVEIGPPAGPMQIQLVGIEAQIAVRFAAAEPGRLAVRFGALE